MDALDHKYGPGQSATDWAMSRIGKNKGIYLHPPMNRIDMIFIKLNKLLDPNS